MDNITLALIKAIAGNSGGGSVTPGKDGVGISKIEKTDTQGLVDTYTISYTNGTTTTFTVTNGQDGQDGADGTNGTPGKDGQNGITPTIGENGNWYLGNEDTGKPSRGEKGDKGETGNTGPAGADGAPGTNGQDGSPGEDGFSPTIVENEHNDESTYKLDITTKTGLFTTPNLKGGGGSGGGTGTSDYAELNNKPKINNVEVDGELTSSDLGLVDVNQGSDNAFKYMRVNAQGKVEPYTIHNSDTPSRVYIFDMTSRLSDIYNLMTDPNWDFGVFKEQETDGENRYVKYVVSSAAKRTVENSDIYTIICYPVIDEVESGLETFKIMVGTGEGSSTIGSCREFREIAFQQKTDNTLNTTDKTIVGAINELISDITNCKPTKTNHGTADTSFTLPANQYHTWGEVAALTLTLATGTTGVVNEYHFAFDSGETATTLSLPENVVTDIVVEPSTHYECSIIDNYMTFRDWPIESAGETT